MAEESTLTPVNENDDEKMPVRPTSAAASRPQSAKINPNASRPTSAHTSQRDSRPTSAKSTKSSVSINSKDVDSAATSRPESATSKMSDGSFKKRHLSKSKISRIEYKPFEEDMELDTAGLALSEEIDEMTYKLTLMRRTICARTDRIKWKKQKAHEAVVEKQNGKSYATTTTASPPATASSATPLPLLRRTSLTSLY